MLLRLATEVNHFGAPARRRRARRLAPTCPAQFGYLPKARFLHLSGSKAASPEDFLAGRGRWDLFVAEQLCARSDFAGSSNDPTRHARKSTDGRATPDHSQRRARLEPPTPMLPAAIRIHRVVPGLPASLPNLQLDVQDQRVAMKKGNDKNPGARRAESPRAADRS